MASYFLPAVRPAPGGGLIVDLDEVDAGALGEAVGQTRALLLDEGDADGREMPSVEVDDESDDGPDDIFEAIVADIANPADGSRPADPVLHRLLPDAVRDDDEGASEFRSATESGLRRRKAAALDELMADLTRLSNGDRPVLVPADRVRSWLTGLNDTRLALGTVLGVTAEDDLLAEVDSYVADDESVGGSERTLRAYRIVVYDHLSNLLDAVVRSVDS